MRQYTKTKCVYCNTLKYIAAKGLCRACYSRQQKTGSLEYQRKGIRNICVVEGCEGYVVSHGYCDKHRTRLAKHGHLESTRPTDWGKREKNPLYYVWTTKKRFAKENICKEWHDDFWKFAEDVGERPTPGHFLRKVDVGFDLGPQNFQWVASIPSQLNSEEKKEYAKNWARMDREENPLKYKDASLRKTYGIGIEEYKQMQDAQNNKCVICKREETALNPRTKKPRDLAVDHCHVSGEVRGLLCTECNRGLGGFKDDIELLEKAILYLKST